MYAGSPMIGKVMDLVTRIFAFATELICLVKKNHAARFGRIFAGSGS